MLILQNSFKSNNLGSYQFMKNLLELNQKCFKITDDKLFLANDETKPSIVSQYPKLWKKMPEKKSLRYQESVEKEKKYYGTAAEQNKNFDEDDFMFKIG